jgi:hypothetical protein
MTWGSKRGVALLFALTVGGLLLILAASLLTLYSSDAFSQGKQQQSMQAYWNARAGVERYCLSRTLPPTGVYELGKSGRCKVSENKGDLWFEGEYASQTRKILLISGDPSQRREEPVL